MDQVMPSKCQSSILMKQLMVTAIEQNTCLDKNFQANFLNPDIIHLANQLEACQKQLASLTEENNKLSMELHTLKV